MTRSAVAHPESRFGKVRADRRERKVGRHVRRRKMKQRAALARPEAKQPAGGRGWREKVGPWRGTRGFQRGAAGRATNGSALGACYRGRGETRRNWWKYVSSLLRATRGITGPQLFPNFARRRRLPCLSHSLRSVPMMNGPDTCRRPGLPRGGALFADDGNRVS